MKILFRHFLLLGVCFCAFPVYASQTVVSNFQLWATTGQDTIRVVPIGVSVVNPDGCTDPDSYMVNVALTPAQISRIYSALLAAKTSGKAVRLATSGCQSNRPAIYDVILD